MKQNAFRYWAKTAGMILLVLLAVHVLIYCTGYRGDALRWIPTAQFFNSLMDKLM